ncbi:MAG TPA: cyclomaltodextrinase N-terminal domain-containing protein, partial [Pseudoxanthomonas sp.]|nr:cyclomaltodextrinase N-terminal domain-containing protein [Pseudoxanthomonas sp.]
MRLSFVFCVCLMLGVVSPLAQARDLAIEHLEPASWWVGMQHRRVELMVHGKSIAALSPRLAHTGVAVVDVQKVANPNYLFVTLEFSDDAKPGSFDIEFLDGDRVAARHPFLLQAREAGSAARKGFDPADA